jgi:hypothetical protein
MRLGARQILRIPTSSEAGLDVAAYNQAASGAAYPLREKWVCDVACLARDNPRRTTQATTSPTHFSRSGYLQNARR